MISNKEKIIWTLFGGFLILLFLLSSTDIIIKEKKTEIYPVSVIIGDTSDDFYLNFRKGIDKAALEYSVDVSFITLYEQGDAIQQMELVKREIDDGTKAIVLVPANPVECAKILDSMVVNSPLIIAGNMFPNEHVKAGISMDYEEAGKKLGEAIIAENSPDTPVWLFCQSLNYGENTDVYNGIIDVLIKAGFMAELYERNTEDSFRQIIEGTVYPGDKEAIIAALDVVSLNETADILAGSQVYRKHISGLYGVGSTTKILNQMDRGIIRGVVTSNQFDSGYLCIEKAVEVINSDTGREQIVLDSYYIEKEDIRKSRFEKILYPID